MSDGLCIEAKKLYTYDLILIVNVCGNEALVPHIDCANTLGTTVADVCGLNGGIDADFKRLNHGETPLRKSAQVTVTTYRIRAMVTRMRKPHCGPSPK